MDRESATAGRGAPELKSKSTIEIRKKESERENSIIEASLILTNLRQDFTRKISLEGNRLKQNLVTVGRDINPYSSDLTSRVFKPKQAYTVKRQESMPLYNAGRIKDA